jgi:hypothetical protein
MQPPLPPGARLIEEPAPQRRQRRDPWDVLREDGFTLNNGFRTQGDQERIRRQGYSPAPNSAHLRGDAVDLGHPSLSPRAQELRARQLLEAEGWRPRTLYHDGHLHVGIDGWGAAPGTPGTANFGLPPLPPGAQLVQRGNMAPGNFNPDAGNTLPAPPPNALMGGNPDVARLFVPGGSTLAGLPKEEDAAAAQNLAAWNGAAQPAPPQAAAALPVDVVAPAAAIAAQPPASGGQPPQQAERSQQQGGLPAMDGSSATNHPGETTRGLEAVFDTPGENPARKAALEGYFAALMNGAPLEEIQSVLREGGIDPENIGIEGGDLRERISIAEAVRQRDAQGLARFRQRFGRMTINPAMYETAPLATRVAQGTANIVATGLGVPADVLNGGLRALGVPVSDRPTLGSEWLKEHWNVPGRAAVNALTGGDTPALRTDDWRYAPNGPMERVVTDAIGFTAANALPAMGLVGRGGQIINRVGPVASSAPVLGRGGVIGESVNALAVSAARNPGRTARSEVLAGIGASSGGQIARSALPDSPSAEMIGNIAGGVLGGVVGAGVGTRRPVGTPAPGGQTSRRDPLAPDGGSTGGGAGSEIILPPRPGNGSPSRIEGMARDDGLGPELVGPSASNLRGPIDVAPGAGPDLPLSPVAGGRPNPQELAEIARGISPEDVLPRPSNRIMSLDEHIAAGAGRWREVEAPNEVAELQMRTLRSHGGQEVRFRGPVDAETFIRMNGGLVDQGGELRHMGITNNRPRPDVGGEDRLGPILNNRNGLTYDEAGERLWEAGYFPQHTVRPSVDEVLDLLSASRRGERTFRPDNLDEMQRYYDAQAQRYAVESARQEEAPLVEDPTRPAGDELGSPPVTAYEDLPSITGKVGNINLANIESGEDIGRLLQNVETAFGGFDAARRGKMSFGEIEALADELGMTADDLLRRRQGQALNAEQALAARSILARSSDEVIGLARRATGGTEADRAAFSEALLRHAAIHEQVSGATTEAGRALSALRMAARSDAYAGRIHQLAVDNMGGQGRLDDLAERILDLQRQGVGPGQVTRFAVDAIKPRFSDKLVELWYNSLLSGPQTHVVNTVSNTMTSILQMPEQAIASAIGMARRGAQRLRGVPDDFDRVLPGELGARMMGMFGGAREGVRAFGRTFRTGEVVDQVTKVESRMQEAIPGVTGQVLRTPTRLLASEDEFFKAVARRMELRALAYRQARSEGLRGQAREARVAELVANPPEAMLNRSLRYARYLTFQRPLEGLPNDLSRWTQRHPTAKLFLPFIRTPTNLFRHAIERSPAAPILREVRSDLRAGGERRAIALARVAMGTGIAAVVMDLVDQGVITGGGPADRAMQDLLRADGWQPYSIRIGDTYYSYQRLDPLALTLGVAADLRDYSSHMTARQSEDAGALLITSILRNMQNKTWLSGISDIMGAIEDPERNASSLIGRLAGSIAVPALLSQTARYLDPVQRETREPSNGSAGFGNIVDRSLGAIQNRIPGLSQYLEPRRDVMGREMRSEGGLGPDAVSPIWTRTRQNDPVLAELISIMARVGRPSRFLTQDGVRRELSPREYGRYQELSGRYLREDLQRAMSDPQWHAMSAEERRELVEKIKDAARRAARDELTSPPLPLGAVQAR